MGKIYLDEKKTTPVAKELVKPKPQGKLVNKSDNKLKVTEVKRYLPVRGQS